MSGNKLFSTFLFFDEPCCRKLNLTTCNSVFTTGFVDDVPESDRLLFDQFLNFFDTDSFNRHHITCTFGEYRSHRVVYVGFVFKNMVVS